MAAEIQVEFDLESFGRFLRVMGVERWPSRCDGIECPDCGTFITWKEGTCAGCGYDL